MPGVTSGLKLSRILDKSHQPRSRALHRIFRDWLARSTDLGRIRAHRNDARLFVGEAAAMDGTSRGGDFRFKRVIGEICDLNWSGLDEAGVIDAAWAYYFFSVQFQEN